MNFIACGYFPKFWRECIVCPISKVSNPTKIEELRPINPLPVISKIL